MQRPSIDSLVNWGPSGVSAGLGQGGRTDAGAVVVTAEGEQLGASTNWGSYRSPDGGQTASEDPKERSDAPGGPAGGDESDGSADGKSGLVDPEAAEGDPGWEPSDRPQERDPGHDPNAAEGQEGAEGAGNGQAGPGEGNSSGDTGSGDTGSGAGTEEPGAGTGADDGGGSTDEPADGASGDPAPEGGSGTGVEPPPAQGGADDAPGQDGGGNPADDPTDQDGTGQPPAEDGSGAPGGELPDPGELPDTEQPGTEKPDTEQPGTEQPGTGLPGTEQPGTGLPGTEQPGTEQPPGQEDPAEGTPEVPGMPETPAPSTPSGGGSGNPSMPDIPAPSGGGEPGGQGGTGPGDQGGTGPGGQGGTGPGSQGGDGGGRRESSSSEGVSGGWRKADPERMNELGKKLAPTEGGGDNTPGDRLGAAEQDVREAGLGFPGFGVVGHMTFGLAYNSARSTAAEYLRNAKEQLGVWQQQLAQGGKIISASDDASTPRTK